MLKSCGTCANADQLPDVRCQKTGVELDRDAGRNCSDYAPAPQPRELARWHLVLPDGRQSWIQTGSLGCFGLDYRSVAYEALGVPRDGPKRVFPLRVLEPESEPEPAVEGLRPFVKIIGDRKLLLCPACWCRVHVATRSDGVWTWHKGYPSRCPECEKPWMPGARDFLD